MILYLNGYPLNDGSNGVWLDPDNGISGLEMPSIRTSTGNYAGRDGGYVGAQFFSARDITISGKVFSSNIATLEASRIALQSALLGDSVTLRIITNAGASYVIYCNLLDFQMPIKGALFSAPFKIELLATDPTIYENNTLSLPANIPLSVSGGYTYPVVYPVIYAAGTTPTTITNAGIVAVYPIITLTHIATDPVITNLTTGAFLGLNIVTGSTDSIVINMQQRTALLNGSSIFGDVTTGSSWWFLEPDGNSVTLTSSNSGDTVTSTIAWQSGLMAI